MHFSLFISKRLLLIFWGLTSMLTTAQKTVYKTVDASTISSVEINASQIQELKISTSAKANDIKIFAEMEGEYKDDLIINTQKKAGHFKIGTSFHLLFQHPNDKLSAHKIIAISMEIVLPENLSVMVSGHQLNTHTQVSGNYVAIKGVINNGTFTLNDFEGNGEIQSFNGNIFVDGYNGHIRTFSKYGKVFGKHLQHLSTSLLTLKTVNGNIYINKPK